MSWRSPSRRGWRPPSPVPRRWSSVSLVALLEPGVAPVVVAVALPEALLVVVEDSQTGDPFCAFPEIEVGDQQACRAAVLARQRLPVDLPHHPGPSAAHV